MMNEETRMKRRSDILTADMEGSVVTMDPCTGKYYNFGEVGGSIWNLLEEEITFGELLRQLAAEYGITPEECCQDTEEFLEKLKADRLLESCV